MTKSIQANEKPKPKPTFKEIGTTTKPKQTKLNKLTKDN